MSNSSVKSNDKDIETLLDHWYEQGARIERPGGARSSKTNAIKVYAPNGRDIVVVHTTMNRNGLRNTIDKGRRAGLAAYPGDPHVKNTTAQEAQDMSTIAPQQIDLPPMILSALKGRPSDLLIGSARGAIDYLKRHGSDTFWTREVTSLCLAYELLNEGGMRNLPATIYWLGYRPVEEKKYGRGAQYRWQLVDALDKAKNEILPMTFLKGEIEADEPEAAEVEAPAVTEEDVHAAVADAFEHGDTEALDEIAPTTPVDEAGEAAIWQAEAERLEAELSREREALRLSSAYTEALTNERDQIRQRLSEAERQYGVQHEELLKAEDVMRRQNDRIQNLDAEITVLEEKVETGDSEWRSLAHVPDTMQELNAAAALLDMKIRIQVAPQ